MFYGRKKLCLKLVLSTSVRRFLTRLTYDVQKRFSNSPACRQPTWTQKQDLKSQNNKAPKYSLTRLVALSENIVSTIVQKAKQHVNKPDNLRSHLYPKGEG